MKKRDETFDVMKGIGILAVIIGHGSIPLFLKDFIYTWHMPLFFMISGYFYKQKPQIDYVKANFRQLFFPYLVTSIIIVICAFIKEYINGKDDWLFRFYAMLIGSGLPTNPMLGEFSIGAIWFLQALFWCRIVYNFLFYKVENMINLWGGVLVISIIATYAGLYIFIPTNILQGVQALLFFHIGYMAKNHEIIPRDMNAFIVLAILFLCFVSVQTGSIYMVSCQYGYWPINIVAAIGMTFLIWKVSQKFKKIKFLIYCGRTSMAILCVHIIMLLYLPLTTIHKMISFPDSLDTVINLVSTICVTWLLLRIKIISNLFMLTK